MKKFISFFCGLFAAVFMPVVCVNYFVDPAGVYHPEIECKKIINGLSQGKNVANKGFNIDERFYKRMLVEELYSNKNMDYVVLGPSRVFLIDTMTLHTCSVLNLGVSAAQVNDFISLYQICKDNGVKMKNIIIGCDATMFNITDTRWQTNERYYNEFLGNGQHLSFRFDKIANLVSPSYFQDAIKTAVKDVLFRQDEIIYTEDYVGEYGVSHLDGSISYSSEYRNRSVAEVDREAGTWMHSTFNGSGSVDKKCVDEFELLIHTLKSEGVNIYFFYCPYHPIFYRRIKDNAAIKNGKAVFDRIAKDNFCDVWGSFNPYEVGCSNEDFYDAAHMRKESIDKLFYNFLHGIR